MRGIVVMRSDRDGGHVLVSKVLGIGLATVMTVALVGCGSPSGTPSGNTDSGAIASWDINQTPRDKLVSGDLVAAIASPISNWNLACVDGSSQEAAFLMSAISPDYYDYDGNGVATMNPDYLLAAEPAVADAASGQQLVVNLTLNPKAVWNDGSPIQAEDWIATWKAMNGSNPDYAVADTTGWDALSSVTAGSDSFHVVLTFNSTYPDWIGLVAGGPMHADGVAAPKVFNQGWTTFHDEYFTGPFEVTDWNKTSGVVTMAPNPHWWGDPPLLTSITWKPMANAAMAPAFANQEVDYFDIGPDVAAYAQAASAADSQVRVGRAPDFRQFTFNSKSPNLSDVRVRQAIVMGLDRGQLAASDLAGLPVDQTPLNNNLYVKDQAGYVDQAEATGIDYDPTKAAALLDAAGWKLNDTTGYREKDGKELQVNYVAFEGLDLSENEGLQAQQMLKQIGVNLIIKQAPQSDYLKVLTQHEFDIVSFSWSRSAYPLSGIEQIYGGTVEAGAFVPNPQNVAQLEIPAVQELAPQIATDMDPMHRAELGNKVARAIWESVHTLPLYQRPAVVGVRAKLANIGALGLARSPKWQDVGFTQ